MKLSCGFRCPWTKPTNVPAKGQKINYGICFLKWEAPPLNLCLPKSPTGTNGTHYKSMHHVFSEMLGDNLCLMCHPLTANQGITQRSNIALYYLKPFSTLWKLPLKHGPTSAFFLFCLVLEELDQGTTKRSRMSFYYSRHFFTLSKDCFQGEK